MPAQTQVRTQPQPHSGPPAVPPDADGRSRDRNPDHHIWCNNGTYFVHLTLLRGGRRFRLRKSLKTKDLDEARRRRDRMVAFIREQTELTLLLR